MGCCFRVARSDRNIVWNREAVWDGAARDYPDGDYSAALYLYHDEPVVLITPIPHADQPTPLAMHYVYDAVGTRLGAPFGGPDGGGDGSMADWDRRSVYVSAVI